LTRAPQANWVANYIKQHRGSLSQWRGLMHGIERIHRGQVHHYDNAFSLPAHSRHAGLHGDALRGLAAPPPKKHDQPKDTVLMVERARFGQDH